MAKKKTDAGMDIKEFHEAMTSGLSPEMQDMERQLDELVKQNIALENRYNTEHKLRMQERSGSDGQQLYLHRKVQQLTDQLHKERLNRELALKKKRQSVPVFVVIAALAFVMLLVPNILQKFSVIGSQLSYAIQSILMMVTAFCYAVILERSGK